MSDTSPHSPLDPSTPWDSASLRRVAEAATDAGAQALVRLDAIRALHQPIPDRLCRTCCITVDDIQSEDCADLHDHSEGQPICATVAILDADLDGGQ